jgi:hypothetical protein
VADVVKNKQSMEVMKQPTLLSKFEACLRKIHRKLCSVNLAVETTMLWALYSNFDKQFPLSSLFEGAFVGIFYSVGTLITAGILPVT